MVVQSLLLNLAQVVALVNATTQTPNLVEQSQYSKSSDAPIVSINKNECTAEEIMQQSRRVVQIILGPSYDKFVAPSPLGVVVSVELALQSFYDVSEMSATFTADVLMSQIWLDERLRFDIYTNCLENLTLSSAIIEKLWLPHVCFVNSKRSDLHVSPSKNAFLTVYSNGTLWINYRMRVEGPCFVDLSNFPFNGEECALILESYAYNSNTVKLRWWSSVIHYPTRSKLPDFVLSNIVWAEHQFTDGYLLLDQGDIDLLADNLDHKSLPARISLGVSSLMSISIQYSSIVRSIPRVSYIMAVDIWVFASFSFIGATLIELTIVGYLDRKERRERRKAQQGELEEESINQDVRTYGTFLHRLSTEQNGDQRLQPEMGEIRHTSQRSPSAQLNYRIFQARFLYKKMRQKWHDPDYWDDRARIYFPSAFFIFNILFWSYVCYNRWRENNSRYTKT
ncbi:Ligand-gated ion channel 50 [Aphelenchoides besseyi]|nr:Ligand-gated ion channel 50 [Aphelenchoides besseyi]